MGFIRPTWPNNIPNFLLVDLEFCKDMSTEILALMCRDSSSWHTSWVGHPSYRQTRSPLLNLCWMGLLTTHGRWCGSCWPITLKEGKLMFIPPQTVWVKLPAHRARNHIAFLSVAGWSKSKTEGDRNAINVSASATCKIFAPLAATP